MPARFGYQPTVFINGSPDLRFHALSIERSTGGNKADHCTLDYDLAQQDEKLQAITLRDLYVGAQCEVVGVGLDGAQKVLHWGAIDQVEMDIGTGDENGIGFNSQMQRWHFGNPVTWQRVFDPTDSPNLTAIVGDPVVFNPLVDDLNFPGQQEVIKGNMNPDEIEGQPIFLSPLSTVNEDAAEIHKTHEFEFDKTADDLLSAEFGDTSWTLAKAVKFLCVECNREQKYIQNPEYSFLERVAILADNKILRNVKIRTGAHLPEALDTLLEPYGFTWTVDLHAPGVRQIRVIRLGEGPINNVGLQAVGSDLDTFLTEIEKAQIDCDHGASLNKITVYGDFTEVEAMFDLRPGWDPDYDDTRMYGLCTDNPAWEQFVSQHDVHRVWVLDEDGGLGPWRHARSSSLVRAAGEKFTDLTPYFREAWGDDHPPVIPKRRKFKPTISLGEQGQPIGLSHGVTLIWYDPDANSGAGKWKPIPSDAVWNFDLLKEQCGIRFTGVFPPYQLYSKLRAGKAVKLRICAVIQSDSRPYFSAAVGGAALAAAGAATGFAAAAAGMGVLPGVAAGTVLGSASGLPDPIEHIVDGGNKFHCRKRISLQAKNAALRGQESLYGEWYRTNPIDGGDVKPEIFANELDSREAIQQLAIGLLSAWNQSDIFGSIQLEGIDRTNHAIGDLVYEIAGRDINLTAGEGNISGDASPFQPTAQVMGIRVLVQEQKTVLHLRSFRDSDSYFAGLIGRKSLPGV